MKATIRPECRSSIDQRSRKAPQAAQRTDRAPGSRSPARSKQQGRFKPTSDVLRAERRRISPARRPRLRTASRPTSSNLSGKACQERRSTVKTTSDGMQTSPKRRRDGPKLLDRPVVTWRGLSCQRTSPRNGVSAPSAQARGTQPETSVSPTRRSDRARQGARPSRPEDAAADSLRSRWFSHPGRSQLARA